MPESAEKPLVVIRSLVYNHEPYLRDCLEGFVMQQTTFPFVAVVHDDCSTDGSTAIIREYAEKYPHIIKPVYETENQYSKHDGSLRRVMDEACSKYGAKYYALCEGDDYWTDPHKLQKQVDFLESNPDYTMVCSDAVVRTPEGDLTEDDFLRVGWYRYHESRDIATEDIIEKGGWFIHTASIVYRGGLREAYPAGCLKAPTGDYLLQMFAAITGKVFYFHEKMVVYRYGSANSWTNRERSRSYESHLNFTNGEIAMLECLDKYSEGKYGQSFKRTIANTIKRRLLNAFPQKASETCKCFGRYILYNQIRPCYPSPRGLGGKAQMFLMRMCCFPYYPFDGCTALVRPIMKPFVTVDWGRIRFHFGRMGLATFIQREDNHVDMYILGVRIP